MSALDEVARVARDALGATGLAVTTPTAVVTSVGTPPDHEEDRAVPLHDPGGQPIGTLRVAWPPEAPGRNRESLLAAFARHLALALSRHTLDAPAAAAPEGDVLTLDDPARLPDAIREITGQVTAIVGPLTGARAVGITAWDPERRILRALPGAFGSDDDTLAASVTGPVTNMLSAGSRVFASGQPYLSNDAGADPGVLQPYAEVFRIGRLLSVPLENQGRRVGVLHLANKPTDFTLDDVGAVEGLAPRLAAAVELAGALGRMAAAQRLEGVLTATATAVATGGSAEECLLPSFDRLAEETGASVVALVPSGSAPWIRRAGASRPDLERRLVRDARALVATSSGAYPRHVGDPGWAALHVPVDFRGERSDGAGAAHTATLSLLRRTGQPFTAAEEDVVRRLAGLVALAWTSERYQRQLAEIARLREQERIADGLHDRVAQILFAARLGIDTVVDGEADDVTRCLVEVRELLVHGDVIVREVIHRLEAAPEVGLTRRLRREVESVEDEFGVTVRVELPDDDHLAQVPRTVADAVVKIAREGTVNAAKHAGPCRIRLDVTVAETELVVEVTDDGFDSGVEAARPGTGLTSLRRVVDAAGGTLTLTTPGHGFGTQVRAVFPV
ncbi:GAF domain-containing sensor histidine kinase [Actinomycetospora chibensis]|uniref:GAF domain-containing sensor histidine kinase n=1 Tax=Actinomycetospora chibensis TaxID=663606 RepID=A0ABV9RHQ9_9PSEU|nr:GAF domain-containing protein [Actinomycetospora chibensis]MDD7927629.1 GAF domain-containing protein [Actinomycetospora chibensis]